jgi:hypothetical protein
MANQYKRTDVGAADDLALTSFRWFAETSIEAATGYRAGFGHKSGSTFSAGFSI